MIDLISKFSNLQIFKSFIIYLAIPDTVQGSKTNSHASRKQKQQFKQNGISQKGLAYEPGLPVDHLQKDHNYTCKGKSFAYLH